MSESGPRTPDDGPFVAGCRSQQPLQAVKLGRPIASSGRVVSKLVLVKQYVSIPKAVPRPSQKSWVTPATSKRHRQKSRSWTVPSLVSLAGVGLAALLAYTQNVSVQISQDDYAPRTEMVLRTTPLIDGHNDNKSSPLP